MCKLGGECDDTRPSTYPYAPEVCDSIDNNCNGAIDEGTSCVDDDLDGFTKLTEIVTTTIHSPIQMPMRLQTDKTTTANIIDEGTDTLDDDGDCYCEASTCLGPITTNCSNLLGDDCDDGDSTSTLARSTEDGTDNNCDGDTDEDSVIDAQTWYQDSDGQLRNGAVVDIDCYQPSGYVSTE